MVIFPPCLPAVSQKVCGESVKQIQQHEIFHHLSAKIFLRTPQLFSELEIFEALQFAPSQSVYGIPSEGFLGSPNLSTLNNN